MASQTVLKRRNAAATKDRILAAGKEAFSRLGYSPAGIREIAAAAGVQSTLVGRYFGSKAGLFEAALLDFLHARPANETLLTAREGFGRRLADRLLREKTNIQFPLFTLSGADAEARSIGNKVIKDHILPPFAAWLGPPNAEVRAVNLLILSCGFALHLQQARSENETNNIDPLTTEWFAKAAQDIVDQSIYPLTP